MPGRFRHAQHVFRVAGLFASGFIVFLIVRWIAIPPDFGVYGFFRAGALDDVKKQAVVFAGATACNDCHGDIVPEKSVHKPVHCEACHGPMATHAGGNFDTKPKQLNLRTLCLTCHTKVTGKPETFPQIVPADHGSDGPCTTCHTPHNPKIG
jgi:hypothetical protein